MTQNLKIRFSFDYLCTPIWLLGDICGDWLISRDGYFYSDFQNNEKQRNDIKIPEKRLKGEIELEEKVKLIYDIHSHLFDINQFPNGEPYLGFTDKLEENKFYDACDYVIKRMKEIFGDNFSVNERDEQIIQKRTPPIC